MARCRSASGFIIYFIIIGFVWTLEDDRIHFDEENMRRWNTPPRLIIAGSKHEIDADNNTPRARFIPFSASFALNSGANNVHSLSVGGTNDGITVSQSQSSSSAVFGDTQSGSSTSQSSSFSAGLSGISASDANAFNVNHPRFGNKPKSNSNTFSLGQAASSSHGYVINNQAITSAQSSTGSRDHHSFISSDASSNTGSNHHNTFGGEANHSTFQGHGHINRNPSWTNIRPNYDPYNSPQKPQITHKPYQSWNLNSQNGNDESSLHVSAASAVSGSSSTSSNGFAFGQSMSQSNWGPNGPMSSTNNHVQTFGNAQSNAQGAASAVGQHSTGKIQASFSSGGISGSSEDNGHSQGTSQSNSHGENSRGDVTSQAIGISNVQGSANAGSVSSDGFPGNKDNNRNIHQEFIRNGGSSVSQIPTVDQNRHHSRKIKHRNPIDIIWSDFANSFVNLFDI